MKLFREKAGTLAPVPVWVFIESSWLYIHESLWGLFLTVLCEWRHDKHIGGWD